MTVSDIVNSDLSRAKPPLLTSFLAAAVLALIPWGPVLTFSAQGSTASLSASQIAIVFLAVQLFFSSLLAHNLGRKQIEVHSGLILVLLGLMIVPTFTAQVLGAAASAYLNFSFGIVGGILVGAVWAQTSRAQLGWVDAGLGIFLVGGATQLVISFSGSSDVAGLHQSSQTPWGNSNYVAGALVVGSIALLARIRSSSRRPSIFAYLPALMATAVALLTLSRGAVIALCVGAVVFVWNMAERPLPKFFLRAIALVIPFVALFLIDSATSQRLAVNSRVLVNVDSRFELFRLAAEEFASSPFIGTGWLSFRGVSGAEIETQSFAHNLVLSFLQIGGLVFGLPVVTLIVVFVFRACRSDRLLSAAALSAIAISMTDPFFEGTVGGILVWAVVVKCVYGAHDGVDLRAMASSRVLPMVRGL
ncbi:O-antigen ligase family protein [Plantibacter sp. Mn2098]|uniref:O-antigen ligase family protein n=1 Tax=Plantibacter sp. Mn2098 TaxID=3395266 RepID=UPI003BDCE277